METNNRPNGKAIASLIVSCISIINCCMWQLAILCSAVGVVLGILALRDENKRHQDIAVAGIVVGGVGFALGVVIAVLQIMIYSAPGSDTIVPGSGSSGDAVMIAINRIRFML